MKQMTRSVFGRKHNSMLRREKLKLDIEIRRCRRYKRQHLPVKFVLEDQRWKRKANARRYRKTLIVRRA